MRTPERLLPSIEPRSDIIGAVFAECESEGRQRYGWSCTEKAGKAFGTKHVGKARNCQHHDATGYEPLYIFHDNSMKRPAVVWFQNRPEPAVVRDVLGSCPPIGADQRISP